MLSLLVKQLTASVESPAPTVLEVKRKAATAKRHANLLLGGRAQTTKAITRYEAALHDWVSTQDLELRLGYARNVCNSYLRKLHAEGRVLRRNKDDAKKYNVREGYEWKWNNDQS